MCTRSPAARQPRTPASTGARQAQECSPWRARTRSNTAFAPHKTQTVRACVPTGRQERRVEGRVAGSSGASHTHHLPSRAPVSL
eukprot:6174625-Prymnesium_polylepis.2